MTNEAKRNEDTVEPLVRHIFKCPNCKRETVGPDPAKHYIVDGVMCGVCWADIGPGDLVRTETVPSAYALAEERSDDSQQRVVGPSDGPERNR